VGSTVARQCILPDDLKHVHESFFNFRCLGVVGEQQHKGTWTRTCEGSSRAFAIKKVRPFIQANVQKLHFFRKQQKVILLLMA